jgi:hypothetical protein
MTDQPDDHKADAERKKAEAAQRLQEALKRKQQGHANLRNDPHGSHQKFTANFTPRPQRRGPRGG